jgi:dipeptidyl aminopeptidase/acylaminoacyl peptidase
MRLETGGIGMAGTVRAFTLQHLLDLKRPTGFVPVSLSPNGRWLTLTARPVYEGRSSAESGWVNEEVRTSRVLVIDTATGESREPFPPSSSSWGGQWSPDSSRLAAYVSHEGPPCLGVWEVSTGEGRLFRSVLVRPCYGCEVPRWTPDGRYLVLKLVSEDRAGVTQGQEHHRDAEPTAVTVFSFPPAASSAPELPGEPDELYCDLGCVDVTTGEVRRLARGWELSGWRVAPDGRALAVLRKVGWAGRDRGEFALEVVPLNGSPPRQVAPRVVQRFGINLNWSPDSRWIAYTTLEAEYGLSARLCIVPADGSAAPTDLTGDESLDLVGENLQDESPRWSADGRTVYCLAAEGVQVFAADESVRRTLSIGSERRLRFWVQSPTGSTLWTANGSAMLCVVRDPTTKKEGLARLDLASGHASLLIEFDQTCGGWADGIFKLEGAPDGSACYLVLEAAHHPAELWRVRTDSGALERLWALNPQLDGVALGRSRLVDYRTGDGNRRQAALLLPPSYTEGQRVPLIVHVYDDNFSNWLHYFGLGKDGYENGQLYAGRGYAVLRPDLPLGDRDPLRPLPGLVLPAVLRLIELGIADPDRIGLMGFSNGGYLTLALLTQTTLFRAAVAVAGIVNLISFYAKLDEHGGSWGVAYCEGEGAPGRMGGSLWENRDAYIENSPLFYLDRVQTPVLLAAGTGNREDAAQAREAFSALRRLGRRVELRLYRGESHAPFHWSCENLRNLCDHVLDWFETYLGQPDSSRRLG